MAREGRRARAARSLQCVCSARCARLGACCAARLPPQGLERVADVSGPLAVVESRAPWDGGEGEETAEDEFDLADIMGEELEEKEEL